MCLLPLPGGRAGGGGPHPLLQSVREEEGGLQQVDELICLSMWRTLLHILVDTVSKLQLAVDIDGYCMEGQ